MSRAGGVRELPYEAKARIADNLFVQRRRAELSQDELGEAAMVSMGQVGSIETGKSVGMLDTWVRLAGALSLSLDDLLAGQLSRALGHHSAAFTLSRYTHLLPGDEAPPLDLHSSLQFAADGGEVTFATSCGEGADSVKP
jgi:transcriptional regulator with XRE-family HTH domain